jgi:serine/threonine protein kinase
MNSKNIIDKPITAFNFPDGKKISNKYKILYKLGSGWEGEVYKIVEFATGIEKAIKFYLPHRNPNNKVVKIYATKLHKLRSCPIVIKYLTQGTITFKGYKITYLISDFVEGETLEQFILKQKGHRLHFFQSLIFLHQLVKGVEQIHALGEYHGDLHTDNIIVRRKGIGFDIKLLDLFHYGTPKAQDYRDDLLFIIRIFYDILGGKHSYPKLPEEIKYIVAGLKKTLILQRFKNLSQLRSHLENFQWSSQ